MFRNINGIPLSDISSTMLLTLYGRVKESLSKDPILKDPMGEKIVEGIYQSLLHSESKVFRNLARFKITHELQVHAAIRAKQYDAYSREFLEQYPESVVVNLGCGLDTRFWRIDNGSMCFYDLDLPEVIQLKKTLVHETERYRMTACSVLDNRWLDEVTALGKPVLLLAEGLFMYLPYEDVKKLIQEIGKQINKGQLVAEVVNDSYTRGINKIIVAYKFKYEIGFDKGLTYSCGLKNSREFESWSPKFHLIDDWSYFDSDEKKLGVLKILGKIKSFRTVQWTVRYRIGV